MSGGHYDYMYSSIRDMYVGKMHDEELNSMMDDICDLLYELEWWQSGDTNEEHYRDAVAKFKGEWFDRTVCETMDFYADKLREKCNDYIHEMLGQAYEDEKNGY